MQTKRKVGGTGFMGSGQKEIQCPEAGSKPGNPLNKGNPKIRVGKNTILGQNWEIQLQKD